MHSKWIDLMVHRGTIACAEIRFKRNKSRSNFNAMCQARVMYEAAVEAIGKYVVAQSMETEDTALRPLGCDPSSLPRRPESLGAALTNDDLERRAQIVNPAFARPSAIRWTSFSFLKGCRAKCSLKEYLGLISLSSLQMRRASSSSPR